MCHHLTEAERERLHERAAEPEEDREDATVEDEAEGDLGDDPVPTPSD